MIEIPVILFVISFSLSLSFSLFLSLESKLERSRATDLELPPERGSELSDKSIAKGTTFVPSLSGGELDAGSRPKCFRAISITSIAIDVD